MIAGPSGPIWVGDMPGRAHCGVIRCARRVPKPRGRHVRCIVQRRPKHSCDGAVSSPRAARSARACGGVVARVDVGACWCECAVRAAHRRPSGDIIIVSCFATSSILTHSHIPTKESAITSTMAALAPRGLAMAVPPGRTWARAVHGRTDVGPAAHSRIPSTSPASRSTFLWQRFWHCACDCYM